MKLNRVTMTGPDDSIGSNELIEISREFPFVEWGILVSATHTKNGSSRFPCRSWINNMRRGFSSQGISANLSLHVCGRWVRELLAGQNNLPGGLADGFQRIQLNFHAEGADCDPKKLHKAFLAMGKRQFIFQIDGANGNEHLEALFGEKDSQCVDAVGLFDVSGGKGELPTEWPRPQYMENDVDYAYHGYAGGLGPHNLAEQLPLIFSAADTAAIWIDMETHIRSVRDRLFDLDKVRECLKICAPHIRK